MVMKMLRLVHENCSLEGILKKLSQVKDTGVYMWINLISKLSYFKKYQTSVMLNVIRHTCTDSKMAQTFEIIFSFCLLSYSDLQYILQPSCMSAIPDKERTLSTPLYTSTWSPGLVSKAMYLTFRIVNVVMHVICILMGFKTTLV